MTRSSPAPIAPMVVVAVVAVALAAGCGLPAAPTPLFSSDPHGDNPFPDERVQDEHGAIATDPDALRRFLPKGVDTAATDSLLTSWSSELAAVDGWGTFAPVLLRFGPAADGSSFDGAGLDPAAVSFVALPSSSSSSSSSSPSPASRPIASRATWHADPGVLELQPTSPVAAHARIGAVVLRTLVKGHDLPRAAAFDAWAKGAGQNDVAAAAKVLGRSVDDIALLVTYRTADNTADLVAARDLLRDVVPAFHFDDLHDGRHGVFSPVDAPASLTSHPDQLAARLQGAGKVAVGFYTSRDVRDPATHLFSADVLAGRTAPIENDVEVVLVEPDPAQFPPPWPAVILQHGFQGSNQFVVDNAAPFVTRGLAVLGIDAVDHGQRGPITAFFNLTDPRSVRDNLRQTTVDHLLLSNLATKAAVDVDGVPGNDLDGSLAYYGHSMGAILGSSFAMITESADVVAVNAPGGGLCDVFRSSGLEDTLQLLIRPLLGIGIDDPVYTDAFPLLTALAQPLLEGADPIAYARASSRPHVLLQLDVGDQLVPNGSTHDLARAAAIPDRSDDDATAPIDALVTLEPATFSFPADQNPHGMFDVAGIQAQAAQFIATRGTQLIAAAP